MKFEVKSLRSKFSRRIFALFLLSALIPVITIFFISLSYISDQLENATKEQIYQESRSLGLSTFDRLLSVETNLKVIANELQRGMQPQIVKDDDWTRSVFSGMYILTEDGRVIRLYGNTTQDYKFNDDDLGHLSRNKPLLHVQHRQNQTSQVFMTEMMMDYGNSRAFLVGQINNDFFWQYGIYDPEFVCVLDKSGYADYCSWGENGFDRKNYFKSILNSTKSDFHTVKFMGQEFAVNTWEIFLGAEFGTDDLSILMAVPKKVAFAAFDQYKAIFPQILMATTLLVALLSISQIRKSLVPLEKLTEGTRHVAKGEFDKPVILESDDEFEDLARSFNNMTRRIDEQIKTTKMLAEIDHLILSSLDSNYIVETLIKHLHNVLPTDHVSVVTFSDESRNRGNLNINIDDEFNSIERQNIYLTDEEVDELESCKSYILLDSHRPRSYIVQQRILGDRAFIVYPVHIKNKFSGIICLSARNGLQLDEKKLKQLRELSDRVAVALSNAAWEEKLYRQAHYDALTGLPNRFLFKDRFEQALEGAKRTNSTVAILFIDLDRFKSINDSLGHEYGDKVLAHVARTLNRCVRVNETLARFGGDEFLILISSSSSDTLITKASKLSERILKAMSKSFSIDSQKFYITPSIGIAVYPHDAEKFDHLLKNADSAMYKAKAGGRASYRFYSRDFNADALARLEVENELRNALQRDEFDLLYQPIINCHSYRIIGVETLLRWRHAEKGLLPQDYFINLAETSGLISDVGYWVLETACKQNFLWQNYDNINIHMAVNLSANLFRQSDLFERIFTIVYDTGAKPENLELEITEAATIENINKTIKTLNQFRELGFSISIDDFGTGYSSMAHLHQFPINKLKIDRSFITDIPDNSDNASIIKAIIALAHSLGLFVGIEGVEIREQYDLVLEMGCDEIQGSIISEPLTADDFKASYKENKGYFKLP